MSQTDAPYAKTSEEAFKFTHIFPNGYRRITDPRSVEQKIIDLQNEMFRRLEILEKDVADLRRENAELTSKVKELESQLQELIRKTELTPTAKK